MAAIEFLYDFGSPNSYLLHKVLPGLAARHGVELTYVPILLGGVFKATNNQSPMTAFAAVTGKLSYQTRQIARFVDRYGLNFAMNPHFPINTLHLMRGAVHAQGKPWETAYIDTIYDAMWVDSANLGDPEVIGRVLTAASLPVEEIMSATQSAEIKQGLIDSTDAAVARGAFGSPTMFVGDEMFFGKDSLDEIEWYLGRG